MQPKTRVNMKEKIDYVLGFLFTESKHSVVLIKKQKPVWQKNLLNGVGGKIEEGENQLEAMMREFEEETNVITKPEYWSPFCEMNGKDFNVYCWKAFNDISYWEAKTMEKEVVYKISISDLPEFPHVSNLDWLIYLALDFNNENPHYAYIKYQ
jgi:8-oxo-dGTP diphosphatase